MTSKEQPDLYAVLGVEPDASGEQITHAYRVLLRHHHPDTQPSTPPYEPPADDSRLRQVLSAYAVLRDPARRADYDRTRARHPRTSAARAPSTPPNDIVVIGTINPTPTATWITTTDQASPLPPARDPVREWIRAMLHLQR